MSGSGRCSTEFHLVFDIRRESPRLCRRGAAEGSVELSVVEHGATATEVVEQGATVTEVAAR